VATAEPKYSAAAFRKLLAKLAAAKAEASAKVEAQIKDADVGLQLGSAKRPVTKSTD
jgi:hypothetical protein